jgi:hypothetical protein
LSCVVVDQAWKAFEPADLKRAYDTIESAKKRVERAKQTKLEEK